MLKTPFVGDPYEFVGAYLQEKRRQRGETLLNVALAIGMSPASIGNIENGRQRLMVHSFLRWCDFLEVDPADVLSAACEESRTARLP